MKFSTVFLILTLLLTYFVGVNSIIGYIAEEFAGFVLHKIFNIGWSPLDDLMDTGPANESVKHKLNEIIHKIDDLSIEFKHSVADIKEFVKLEARRSKIQDIQDQIEVKFNKTIEYVRYIEGLENDTISDLIAFLTQGANPIEDLSNLYHVKVFGKDKIFLDDAIDLIKKNVKHFVTKTGESEHVIVFKYFLCLLSVEYKAMILQKLTYLMKIRLGKGQFVREMYLAQKIFVRHVNDALESMRKAFRSSSREIYKLDPPEYARGKTYAEVTRFNQVYFTSEANFGTCKHRCENFGNPKPNFNEDYKIDQRLCRGTVHQCKSENANGYYFYVPKMKENDKRYHLVATQISYDNFVPHLNSFHNDSEARNAKIIPYSAWTRWFVNCDICRCLCDDEKDQKSIRKFSLSPMESDMKNNMVISGVQIELDSKNKMFYLKMRQSKLLPLGRVEHHTKSEWISLDSKKLTKDNVFTLTYTNNSVFVGTAEIEDKHKLEYVVTRVNFANKGGILALEVCFTKFNVTTGKLIPTKDTICKSNEISKPSNLSRGTHRNRPTKYKDNALSDKSSRNGLVQFESSKLEDDVGQSTVPYLDLQPVESTYAALSGVGLKLRSRDSSGGFLAPSLVTRPFFDETKKIELPDKMVLGNNFE